MNFLRIRRTSFVSKFDSENSGKLTETKLYNRKRIHHPQSLLSEGLLERAEADH